MEQAAQISNLEHAQRAALPMPPILKITYGNGLMATLL
jgi:hypothetical protein